MWLDMVEFRSVRSEIRGRKKKKERIVVKHKSTDKKVGRPNKVYSIGVLVRPE